MLPLVNLPGSGAADRAFRGRRSETLFLETEELCKTMFYSDSNRVERGLPPTL